MNVSPTYKYLAIAGPGWMQAYGYPEGWADKEWVGRLSKDYVQRYRALVIDDVRYGAPRFRKLISVVYPLEAKLLDRSIPKSEDKVRELVRDTLLFFGAKYIIRDLYLSVVTEVLEHEFPDDRDIFFPTRPDIITELATDPRYQDIGWDTAAVKIREYANVPRFAPERYVKKYKVLWERVMEKGAPPEVLIKYLAMIYVHDEAQAFAHREDFATFNAIRRIRRGLELLGLTDGHLLSRGWLAYDGTKVLD